MKEKKRHKKIGKLKTREALTGYLFILPWLIGVIVFVIRPFFQSFNYALSSVKMTPKGRIITFIGMKNFTQILQEDPTFPTELVSYMTKTVLAVPVIVVFALISAIVLTIKQKIYKKLGY